MKFIPLGDKHTEYDFFEDTPTQEECGKPRRIPSYFDTARKHGKTRNGKLPL